jgi:hypothetical protein
VRYRNSAGRTRKLTLQPGVTLAAGRAMTAAARRPPSKLDLVPKRGRGTLEPEHPIVVEMRRRDRRRDQGAARRRKTYARGKADRGSFWIEELCHGTAISTTWIVKLP